VLKPKIIPVTGDYSALKIRGRIFLISIEPYPGEGGLTSENKLQSTIIIQEIRIGFRIFDI
jgi:hypothetical protein